MTFGLQVTSRLIFSNGTFFLVLRYQNKNKTNNHIGDPATSTIKKYIVDGNMSMKVLSKAGLSAEFPYFDILLIVCCNNLSHSNTQAPNRRSRTFRNEVNASVF